MAYAGIRNRRGNVSGKAHQFIEKVGMFFEQLGLPRMAGRILAWLLICDPPDQSMNDLVKVLQASKSSISTMSRMLIQFGLIERTRLPGQRGDSFRIRPDVWDYAFRVGATQITAMRQLAEAGLALLAEQPAEQRQRLEDMRATYTFFEREYPILLTRWEQNRTKG